MTEPTACKADWAVVGIFILTKQYDSLSSTLYKHSLKGAFFYLCQAVSGIDFISISQPSVNMAECLIYSRYQRFSVSPIFKLQQKRLPLLGLGFPF